MDSYRQFFNVTMTVTAVVVTNWIDSGYVSNKIGFQAQRQEAYIGTNYTYTFDYWDPFYAMYGFETAYNNVTNLYDPIDERFVKLNGVVVDKKLFWKADMIGILKNDVSNNIPPFPKRP